MGVSNALHFILFQNTVLRKPPEDNMPSDDYASNHTRNGTIKKSSNITATTSDARRSSELESARKLSRDHTTISAADEPGNFLKIFKYLYLFPKSFLFRMSYFSCCTIFGKDYFELIVLKY